MKDMRFDNIVSLFYFTRVIRQTIKSSVQGYECWIDNQGKPCGDNYSGSYFVFMKNGSKVKMYPWFGISYGEIEPTISIEFSQQRSKIDFTVYVGQGDGDYFAAPYEEENSLIFELKQDVLSDFLTSILDKQKEILKGFFEEVIRKVGGNQ
ncbi:MAG: hypothetical protein HQL61_08455 [Magnetococcales bacterium]|nr:hypothetical protein [Nitrospirota bacterium]